MLRKWLPWWRREPANRGERRALARRRRVQDAEDDRRARRVAHAKGWRG